MGKDLFLLFVHLFIIYVFIYFFFFFFTNIQQLVLQKILKLK